MIKKIYDEKPPLVEVIAEIRWRLQRLTAIPESAIDPHFSTLKDELIPQLDSKGFSIVEKLVPDEVPLEWLAHRPTFRLRKKPNTWPVYQFGPGLLTVNMVPPYQGWKEFRQLIQEGMNTLYQTYPLPEKYLKIERIQLVHIDGFNTHAPFINKHLNIKLYLPPKLIKESLAQGQEITQFGEARIPLEKPKGSLGLIKIAPAKIKQEEGTLVELMVRTSPENVPQQEPNILEWFDASHNVVRRWFEHLMTDDYDKLMSEKRED